MKKLVWLTLCCLTSLAFLAGGAWGAEFCVDNATELGTALSTAGSNGEDDIIRVVQGIYVGNFHYGSSEGHSITLQGGYTAGCADRVIDPSLTVLDGSGSWGVLSLANYKDGSISVEGFTIHNGAYTGGDGGGLWALSQSASGTGGDITLTNNTFTQNVIDSWGVGGGVYAASYSGSGTAGNITLYRNTITGNNGVSAGGGVYAESYSYSGTTGRILLLNNTIRGNSADEGGGVYAETYTGYGTPGMVVLTNNIITGNSAVYNGGGVEATSDSYSGAAGNVTIINNTITGNIADEEYAGVDLSVHSTGGTINCYNNIIRGNITYSSSHGKDISLGLGSGSVANGYNNDYADMDVSWTNGGSNITVDPLFVNPGNGDYRLRSDSPCKNAGTNTVPPPGLFLFDFEGDPRIIDTTVDIGADEVSILTPCVSTTAALQNALTVAEGDGKGDVIMVVQGTYSGHFEYDASEGYSITLLGGYTSGCASRALNPANTILDGGGLWWVLSLYDSLGGAISVEGFTIQNGDSIWEGTGVYAYSYSPSGTAGDVTVTNNIITGNSTGSTGGGVYAASYSAASGAAGDVTLLNNIITGNTAVSGAGGVEAYSYSASSTAGNITLLNNTITGNSATGEAGYGGGAYLSSWGTSGGIVNCYNNIIWGNTATSIGGDILLEAPASGHNNDYANLAGDWTSEGGNINANPLFVGGGDYHLQPLSPCLDAGLNNAPGIPATDFEGDYRIIDGNRDNTATVDMGADEFSRLPILETPATDTIFDACSLINKYQPAFRWTVFEPFKSFTIFFSTSDTDFSTKGVLITKANIQGKKSSWIPSIGTWKKIMAASYNGGGIRPIYWRVVGTRTNKSTVSSTVWNVSIDVLYPPFIWTPDSGASLHAATPPTFEFDAMCNIKFRLEISSVSNFSDLKKIKAFTYTIKDPNDTWDLQKTLSAGQWTAVKKLIGISPNQGYFRIRAWDAIKRETVSETRSFTITIP